jgi:solute:Na+ symporter, SSS family
MALIYTIVAVYFIVLLAIGYVFSGHNRNASDFIRSGGKAEWWLTGTSALVAGISAYTFTGAASAAYEAGPTLLVLYLANAIAFLIGGLFLGAWLRQTRAINNPEIIRHRFGPVAEQFSVYIGLLTGPFTAAIQLWALSVFVNGIFGFPLLPCIVVIGLVVTLYSIAGGRWAVMAADFVQGILLFSITLVVAWLSMREIGGFGPFFDYFSDARFAADFQWVKEPGQFSGNRFTGEWVVMVFIMQLFWQISFSSADRYLSTKDGREARKAAFFAMFLMVIGATVWFLPPMVARFMFENEILATGYQNPSEASYAFIALKLLPHGLVGILVSGMFAATMSSMDNGLTGQAGSIVHNLIPAIRRRFRMPVLTDRQQLRFCRIAVLLMGLLVIFYGVAMSLQRDFILFEAYLILGSVVGIPLGFPSLVGLYMRKLPRWSYFFIAGVAAIPSVYSLLDEHFFGNPWTIQQRTGWVLAAGIVATVIARSFYSKTPEQSRQLTERFFQTMHTPVDYRREVGEHDHGRQKFILGKVTLVVSLCMVLLIPTAESMHDAVVIAAVLSMILMCSLVLMWAGKRDQRLYESRRQ